MVALSSPDIPVSRTTSRPTSFWWNDISIRHYASCLSGWSQEVKEVTAGSPRSRREVRFPPIGISSPGETDQPTKCVCGGCQYHVGGADGRSFERLSTGKRKLCNKSCIVYSKQCIYMYGEVYDKCQTDVHVHAVPCSMMKRTVWEYR